MRFSSLLLPVALAFGGLSTLSAMDNADLIKMKKADMSDETILLTVDKETPEFDTSPEGLVELKKEGVSEPVIQRAIARMQNASNPAPAAPAPVESAPAATAQPVPGPNPAVPGSMGGPSDLFSVESPSIAPPMIQPVVGQEYFTRFSFHQEKNEYRFTNYGRGLLVPINTPVKVVSMAGDKIILLRTDTNENIKVINVQKYSKRGTSEIAGLMLASEKTPIDRLVPVLLTAIKNGELRKGMTKEQALMARGYPPAHETPSTDGDKWVYWSSVFAKQTVLFANGRLTEGREIN